MMTVMMVMTMVMAHVVRHSLFRRVWHRGHGGLGKGGRADQRSGGDHSDGEGGVFHSKIPL